MTRRWGRGLIRLWILATLIWVVILNLWIGISTPLFWDNVFHPERYPGSDVAGGLTMLAAAVFGPPLAVLVLGLAIAWVLRGFRSA